MVFTAEFVADSGLCCGVRPISYLSRNLDSGCTPVLVPTTRGVWQRTQEQGLAHTPSTAAFRHCRKPECLEFGSGPARQSSDTPADLAEHLLNLRELSVSVGKL